MLTSRYRAHAEQPLDLRYSSREVGCCKDEVVDPGEHCLLLVTGFAASSYEKASRQARAYHPAHIFCPRSARSWLSDPSLALLRNRRSDHYPRFASALRS